jgi:CubicO group peptidase (beta-lactamase class C family)
MTSDKATEKKMQGLGKKLGTRFVSAAVMALSFAGGAQSADAPDIGHAVDSIFQDMGKPDAPGCAVGVQQGGAQPILRGYGSADLEHNAVITPATVFEAGSVSKQFTAASILMLAGEGKLALNDDVHKYIPELPDYGERITIDELLSHTSGLRDWGDIEALGGWPRTSRIYTLKDVLDVAARQKQLNYKPGTAYSYTNTGFNLLAIIVERVSSKTLAQFSHERLFEPLKMSHTQWRDDFRRVVKDRAIAYQQKDGVSRQLMPFEDAYGNGGLLTTVGDLLRWNAALTEGELGSFVTTEIQRQTHLDTGHSIAYARGLFVETYQGVREIAHGGATAGYRAWLGRYPDQHLSIAVLCNTGNANAPLLAHKVAALFLPAEPASPPIVPPTQDPATRAGLYVDLRMGMPLRLEVRSGALSIVDGPALVALSPTEFRAGTTIFRFQGDDRVTRETADGDILEYRRTPVWQPTSRDLMSFAGEFKSEEAMASYRVTIKNNAVIIAPEDRLGEELILHPIFADSFEFADDNVAGVLHFSRDSKGKVSGFEMSDPRVRALGFHRIGGSSPLH